MHDRPKSTLPHPPDPEDLSGGFKEVTLAYFQPEDAAALRRIGKLLHSLILEATPYFGAEDESLTERELEAALSDLVDARHAFWGIGRSGETTSLHPSDARLSRFAVEVTAGLDKIIAVIEEALA
jgi:hypothetical protein